MLFRSIINSLDANQQAYLAAMKGKGWSAWPDITNDQIQSKMQTLPQGTAVAVMTYASDLFSWYAGSVEGDVYFCPERQGTYYGGFYIKDAPAIGHEGYSIDEQLTASAGAALCDSAQGYVTPTQAALISSLVDTQRSNLYAGTTNIVQMRTQIATLLRSLLTSLAASNAVQSQVLTLSGIYGDLDGENNYNYATVFAQVYNTLTAGQKTNLAALRQSIMSGTYSNGTPFDYTTCTTPFLYSSPIANSSVLAPYIADTDYLFLDAVPSYGPLTVTQLRATVNFAKVSNDTCSVTATLDLGGFTPTNQTLVIVGIGGAQRVFTLNSYGRGILYLRNSSGRATGILGTCWLTYNKRTALWTVTATLSRGTWRDSWDTAGLHNDTITARMGYHVTLPVAVLIGSEAFAAESQLHYTAIQARTGTAK